MLPHSPMLHKPMPMTSTQSPQFTPMPQCMPMITWLQSMLTQPPSP
ncbi:unnamed protein product [Acanthoscelides obtectus]|uniref:Uncharacterized protein n=1 Tax=Acanthoscelides obtectus TaxID=200917 RepID=A0A9P0Q7K8_ACAOB|nr:unnamed protein product [Acanthoscelides obtectus]CAK1642760.1 hypothetical protein AOBTE_LOCUS13199 [Acanthoscelides obtectus]